MGSSRFPGKPVAKLLGRTMLEHVYRRVSLSQAVDATFIATCDEEIREAALAFGANVIMTSDAHERASDRVAEAVADMDVELVVMVQGDEPMTRPEMIDAAVAPFRGEPQLGCVNLVRSIDNRDDFYDFNTIKVVMNQKDQALFMSRQPIPTAPASVQSVFPHHLAYKQVCIIPFRRATLLDFARLPPTPLEKLESIDMLRLIEHGYPVKMIRTKFNTQAVDTPADLERVARLMESDPLLASY